MALVQIRVRSIAEHFMVVSVVLFYLISYKSRDKSLD